MKKSTAVVMIFLLLPLLNAVSQSPTYTVEKGDTLYSISRKYNIKIESLKSFNNITDPSKLYPGMLINIPGGYTVKKGDTLYGISKEYGITVDELKELNNMDSSYVLKIGQFLHVPAAAVTVNSPSTIPSTNPEPEPQPTPPVVIKSEDAGWPHTGDRTALTGKLRGVQINGTPGDDIVSVAGGTVVWAEDYGLFKKLVLVEGKNGIVYGYGGNEVTNVRVGDYVSPGSVIGILGGVKDNADVYFFVYKDGKPLDPEKAPRV